ncbi:hypothetical protein VOLCADRAFT_87678 [Volvox carteri f. nagariensis]|uniref:Apple domain-containing protein n=1 Tax=Volvox carteri f. nagariensis TaxID=3068 RepID=D8TLY7_VOLCA|nr:uncharacterized protein VOLCADRAFT_87678 [Volvox carteri f. nagariensis]EFJ51545.1 hypothetical protein VOLCADRAFT_87678 [Volvox carteri f. nagariensis]|eukprot:XP_002947497.1 hypothetical protein VOLCADRAFT_87678 [Volvox carteri f. nagariensis]
MIVMHCRHQLKSQSLQVHVVQSSCPRFYGYIAFPDTDHGGDDLGNPGSAAAAATECAKLPECQGFNVNGWMKASADPLTYLESVCFFKKIPASPIPPHGGHPPPFPAGRQPGITNVSLATAQSGHHLQKPRHLQEARHHLPQLAAFSVASYYMYMYTFLKQREHSGMPMSVFSQEACLPAHPARGVHASFYYCPAFSIEACKPNVQFLAALIWKRFDRLVY